jgi:hypothetical protein
VREGHKPQALGNLGNADVLSGKHLTQIQLSLLKQMRPSRR